uniref:NADH-ubiquinone oxidoreductase chain 4L n=1 Tax=Euspilotus scissus TaxID=694456 RepID=D8WKP6_9COLE|nr:NADH dehydrogenase subunit 4L [Euspilotus scissus]ACZ58579.1 NADH dehydrogenase subunit 4L [Euspilotus scissus]
MMTYICGLIYFSGLLSFSMNRKHLLIMLLCLEMLVLNLYFMMMYTFSINMPEMYFGMIFLVMSACEGALGLSILVSLLRVYGNDYFMTFNVLW